MSSGANSHINDVSRYKLAWHSRPNFAPTYYTFFERASFYFQFVVWSRPKCKKLINFSYLLTMNFNLEKKTFFWHNLTIFWYYSDGKLYANFIFSFIAFMKLLPFFYCETWFELSEVCLLSEGWSIPIIDRNVLAGLGSSSTARRFPGRLLSTSYEHGELLTRLKLDIFWPKVYHITHTDHQPVLITLHNTSYYFKL